MNKIEQIKELVNQLNEASSLYYNTGDTKMSDIEYDTLYNELKQLETETKMIFVNSPTHKVGAEVISELETVKHNHPMLSLDKCHSAEELIDFAGDRDCLLMLKLDGLTISLKYNNHKLISAETEEMEKRDLTSYIMR
jgi:DNA ligase (NAD+)